MRFLVYTIIPKETQDISKAIQETLAPYQSHNIDNCPEEHRSFVDCDHGFRRVFEKGSCWMLRQGKDGPLKDPRSDEFLNPTIEFPINDLHPFGGFAAPSYFIPEGYEKILVPWKQMYPTFDEFMSKYDPSMVRNKKTGKYGYWVNTNARLGAWQIGGEWRDLFNPTYDPMHDPENMEACSICKGTGCHMDANGQDMLTKDANSNCHACEGTGQQVKQQNMWRPFGDDVALVTEVLAMDAEDFPAPKVVVTPHREWIEIPKETHAAASDAWAFGGRNYHEINGMSEWKTQVREILKQYEKCLVVVTDCGI